MFFLLLKKKKTKYSEKGIVYVGQSSYNKKR